MRIAVLMLEVAALLCAIGWVFFLPGWDSGMALLIALGVMVKTLVSDKNIKKTPPRQHQQVSENGLGIQAGGNVTVGDIGQQSKDSEDV